VSREKNKPPEIPKKICIVIPGTLHQKVKVKAAQEKISMTAVLVDAIKAHLQEERAS